MSPIIKICGLTRLEDAEISLQLGADLLGFNFYKPSPRYIEPAAAAKIINQLPAETQTVGIFVNASPDYVAQVAKQCPLHYAQLHGDETPETCKAVEALGLKVIKALRVKNPGDIEIANRFDTNAILLDAFDENSFGGTGQTFNWDWLKSTKNKKIFLAGGINPDNVLHALKLKTYALDLCSGIEKTPGIKDHQKLKTLFQIIKSG